jgi:hypothetical protein
VTARDCRYAARAARILSRVGTKVGQAFPETTLSLPRREALAQAIDLVHDRLWEDIEQLGHEDVSLTDPR